MANPSEDKEKKNPTGRPSIYTQDLADSVCEHLSLGKSLRSVCREEGMPSIAVVFKWIRDKEGFKEQYARAKQEGVEAMAEDIMEISDDGSNDWMERNFGETTAWVENKESVQRSRLRIDTRKWLMSKIVPKKYGDKMDHTSDGKEIKGNVIILKDFNGTESGSQ